MLALILLADRRTGQQRGGQVRSGQVSSDQMGLSPLQVGGGGGQTGEGGDTFQEEAETKWR